MIEKEKTKGKMMTELFLYTQYDKLYNKYLIKLTKYEMAHLILCQALIINSKGHLETHIKEILKTTLEIRKLKGRGE